MDENADSIAKFELLLQQKSLKKPLSIYKDQTNLNFGAKTCSSKDVILHVAASVKAMQSSETVRINKNVRGNLDKYKRNVLLPLTLLDIEDNQPKQSTSKFDTQCVTDTQLIDIVNKAEAISVDTQNQIVNEFDTSFTKKQVDNTEYFDTSIEVASQVCGVVCDDVKDSHRDKNPNNEQKGIDPESETSNERVENDKEYIDDEIYRHDKDNEKSTETSMLECVTDKTYNIDERMDLDVHTEAIIDSETNRHDTKTTHVQNTLVNQEDIHTKDLVKEPITHRLDEATKKARNNQVYEEIEEDIDMNEPPSPILSTTSRNSFHMVCDLATFEEFENLIRPIIENESDDFQSQILGHNFKLIGTEKSCGYKTQIELSSSLILNNKHEEDITNTKICNDATQIELRSSQILNQVLENVITITNIKICDDATRMEHSSSPILNNKQLDEIIILGKDVQPYLKRTESCNNEPEIELSSSPILDNDLLDEIISSNETKKNIDTESNNEIQFSSSPILNKPPQSQSPVIPAIDFLTNDREIPKTSTPDIDFLKDEILFSSDEEEDYIHKENQELPFTCVLETSFYTNQSDVLDKTMYIDFDKCTGTESYMQAKSYIDCIQLSVSELVEKQDRLSINQNDTISGDRKDKLLPESVNMVASNESKNLNGENDPKIEKEVTFVGFKTASNKNIELSQKSCSRIKQVFQDIDLGDDFLNGEQKTSDVFEENGHIDEVILEKNNLQDNKKLEYSKIPEKEFEEFNESKMDIDFTELDRLEDVNKMKKMQSPIQFKGFTTASNKMIRISGNALAKTRKVFQDIDLTENLDTDQTDDHKTIKLAEAGSYKAIDKRKMVSEKSIQASDNVFQDINTPSTSKENCLKEDTPKFIGFKTASNKNVEISKKALDQCKKVFDDIDLDCDLNEGFRGFQTASKKEVVLSKTSVFNDMGDFKVPEQSFQGFQTASKKPVQISKEAMERTKDLFKDIHNLEEIQEPEQKFRGFQTASKKPVQISKEAMEKTKDLFNGIDNMNEPEQMEVGEQKFQEFQSASKKPVQISKEALQKSKDLFKDIENLEVGEQFGKGKHTFKGFQTASKKPVKITNEAIESTKQLFKDIEDFKELKQVKEGEHTFGGFQTASEKPVSISKEAMERTKDLFKDIGDTIVKEPEQGFKGFQTASNKAVNISKTALLKCKDIFKDIDFEHISEDAKVESAYGSEFNNKTELNQEKSLKSNSKAEDMDHSNKDFKTMELSPKFGFQTANKKKVQISRSALERTKRIFQNFEDFDIQKEETKTSPKFSFKTANNNNIAISEESIAKSKRLLAGTDQSQAPKTDQSEARIDELINTQVLNNFAENMNTEDFHTPKKEMKRPGSPILSFPKAKKRKVFQTPYSNKTAEVKKLPDPVLAAKNTYEFDGSYKKHKCLTMTDILNLEKESTEKIVKTNRYEIENVIYYAFEGKRNTISSTKASMNDIKKIFLDSVNQKIVPEGWYENHFKMIVWKLLEYEFKYPKVMKNVCNTKNVLQQLKYRYDKELYKVERSVLRKIMEKDELPSRTMVLSVASILVDGVSVASVNDLNKTIELILTDGWYTITSTIDKMLSKLVYDSKIVVGTKLVVNGAELVNCEQGISPWEDTTNIRLKIFGNSTRRANFSAKLGFHGNAAILVPLTAVKIEGGKVSKLRLFVTRVYPLLYVEKFEDGSTVTRSERLEQIYQMKYETDRQILMEKIYEEVEKEFDQESQETDIEIGVKRRCNMETGSQIAKMLKRSRDPIEFRAQLTPSQTEQLLDYTNKQRDRIIQEIQTRAGGLNRNVATLAKVRVADVRDDGVCCGMLSIWRPNDAILDIIKEGEDIDILNVYPTAMRNTEIQLTAGRQSVFSRTRVKHTDKTKLLSKTLLRKCYDIKEIVKNPNLRTDHNEIDTIGIIIETEPSIEEFEKSSKTQNFQNIYIADLDKNLICLNFWGGIKKFGFQNTIDTGQVVYATNLQKRVGNTRKNIPHFRVTELTWFTKTPKNITAREKIQALERSWANVNKKQVIKECIEAKNGMNNSKYANENISPYRPNISDYNLSKNRIYMESPLAKEMSLTGLDFESTFKQTDTQGLSPEMIARKKRLNEKMAKLKMYGEPPPLSHIHIINKSTKAQSDYKSPLSAKSDKLNIAGSCEKSKCEGSVQNGNDVSKSDLKTSEGRCEKDSEVSKSDGISKIEKSECRLDRTYIKRSYINPVRIDFSELNESTDHFAEDFDGSPPLSLD